MENSIAIKEINLINFKGLKNQTIIFNHVTNIFGDNGVGKTTIFDAFTWLLLGKDSTDRKDFEIKTLDKNNKVIPQIEHEVSAVIDVNGEEILVKRVLREKWVKKRGSLESEFSGNETIYFWNEVPKSQREFQEKISSILNESVFKMITNPLAFNSMKWQDKRTALIDIVGNVSDVDIAGNDKSFVELLNKLSNKSLDEYKKQIAAQRKKMNDEIKSIPTRIDEVSRNTPAALDFKKLQSDKEVLVKSVETIQSQIDDKNKAYDAVLLKRQEVSNEIFSLKSKLQNIEFEVTQSIQSQLKSGNSESENLQKELGTKELELKSADNAIVTLNSQLNSLQNQLNNISSQIDDKRKEWEAENAKELNFNENDFSCPTCKRGFEVQDVQNKKAQLEKSFVDSKNNKLIEINNQGKSLAEQKTSIETSISTLKERIEKGNNTSKELTLDVVNIQAKIENASKNKSETPLNDFSKLVETALLENVEYQNIKKEITVKEVANTTVNPVNVDSLKTERTSLETQIKEIDNQLLVETQIATSNKRVSELENQEQTLAQSISDLEREQFTIENFIKKKIDTLESMINEKFSYVKFKLFETQINGAEVECCHALIDGVPFSDANTASKINAGLDIINTLCEFYKVTAPIFIDNRESIVNIIDCKSQIVNLIVSKPDKQLRVA
ncbi:AAA family ATPase [Tenacibaculum maritimum]|nr:AAA family ATPase [Tenacibaculum maritimum]MDB0612453.1 AAA family ATPase [Tenacibaculum maritimum]